MPDDLIIDGYAPTPLPPEGEGVPGWSLKGLFLPLSLGIGVLLIIAWYTWDEGAMRNFISSVNPWIMACAFSDDHMSGSVWRLAYQLYF